VELAEVVAASSAFPPFLSPLPLRPPAPVLDHDTRLPIAEQPGRLWLTDGGVYDNLGIQTVESFHTVFASDGGAPFKLCETVGQNMWSQHRRSVSIIYDQISRLRQRQFVHELNTKRRLGALWRISTDMSNYPAADTLPCPRELTARLDRIPTKQLARTGDPSPTKRIRHA
jgi:NTE family protein